MTAALLSLGGLFISLYLWLWKIGLVRELACGTGGCEYVQTSPFSVLLGVPVALYGAVGYLTLLAVSLVGLRPEWVNRTHPTTLLAVLSGIGVAFTAYLTYVEAAVLHAWCRWCLASAVIISAIFVTSLVGLKTQR